MEKRNYTELADRYGAENAILFKDIDDFTDKKLEQARMSEYSIERTHDKIGKLKNSISNLEEWNGQKPIVVSSLDLAQQIIDKGFLYCLVGVSRHNRNPTKKVWFFEPNSIISGMVQDYGEQAKQHYYDRDMSFGHDDKDENNEY
jgi:hypothetical protein